MRRAACVLYMLWTTSTHTHTHTHTQHTQRQTPALTLRRVRSSYAMLSQIWRQIYFASQLLQQTLLFRVFPLSPPHFSLILCSFLCCSLSDRFTVASLLAFCCFSWKLLLKITKLLVSFSLCHRLLFRVACQVSSASFPLASFSLNSPLLLLPLLLLLLSFSYCLS